MADVVPFGKYKGRPVETLLADQDYLRWVLAQPGLVTMLQQRHPAVFNIITIGAPQSDDTPEHNRLQARFLDRKFQEAFIECVTGKSPAAMSAAHCVDDNKQALTAIEEWRQSIAELTGRTAQSLTSIANYQYYRDRAAQAAIALAKLKEIATAIPGYRHSPFPNIPADITVQFELGFDVELTAIWRGTFYHENYAASCSYIDPGAIVKLCWPPPTGTGAVRRMVFAIELKPLIGDDFPAVLRQIRANKAVVVVADRFEAVGATLDQVRQIFGDRKLVLVSEIEALM